MLNSAGELKDKATLQRKIQLLNRATSTTYTTLTCSNSSTFMRLHHKKNNQAYLFSDTVAVACPDSNMICNRLMGPTNVGRIVDPHTPEESEANSLMHMNTFFAGWKLN